MGLKIQRQEKIGAMDRGMTGIVLAGGRATRMGGDCDKAFLKIGGEAIINKQLKVLKKTFDEIIVVTNLADNYRHLAGVRVIPDVIRGLGPLGGIYSGLLASRSHYNFVIACDMPFIDESLIRYMIAHKDGYDAAALKIDGKFHPLFGVYSKNCIPVIEELIDKSELRIKGVFLKVKSHLFSKQEIVKFDERQSCTMNINTKEDLLKAEEMKGDLR